MERLPGVFAERVFLAWQVGFTKRTRRARTPRRAWRKITEAGCTDEVLRLLFEYDKAGERIRLLSPRLKHLTHLAKAYQRAAYRVLESRGEPSPLRLRRARESLEVLFRAPWPFTEACAPYLSPKQIAGVKTLRDAVLNWPESFPHAAESLCPKPREYAAVFARAADNLRRFDGKPMLLMLRDRMRKRRLPLGAGELAALACCARSSMPRCMDRKNLAHFFKSAKMKSAAPDYAELARAMFDDLRPRKS
jgi:hypothetical protein